MKTQKFLIIMVALLLLPQLLTSLPKISAEPAFSQELSKIKVDSVIHNVELLEGGLIIINDTVTVSSNESIRVDFPIGFPYDFAPYLLKCFATTPQNEVIPVTLDYGLGKPGFYGVLVALTSMGEKFEINSTPKNFTVTFIFSGPIVMEDKFITLNFTLFPSLTLNSQTCNTTIIVPTTLTFSEASFTYDKLDTVGQKNYYYLNSTFLEKFAYNKAKAWLRLRISEKFTYAEIEKLERKIEVDLSGNIDVTDTYYIKNKGSESINRIEFYFPREGYDFVIENTIGLKISDVDEEDIESNELSIPKVGPNETISFLLDYKLNSSTILSKVNSNFKINLSIGRMTPLLIRELVILFKAPQGARLELSNSTVLLASNFRREILHDSVKFVLNYFTPLDRFQTEITCKLNVFWVSYPYTLIALFSSALILFGAILWRKPSLTPVTAPTTVPKVTVSPKTFRKFVESYEERIKIMSRIERLEEQARKRKISRRQYKVRKTMLENKLSSLTKDIADLKEQIRHSGPRYAEIIRQLEIAEAQLEEAEAGMKRVRNRYRRGEISREAYRRLLDEHERRIEEANVMIQGALLRLREEYH